jgi:benzoyl-CoA reductase/2-hydroxyglutaryl-CoA dehydratase subunit BcrC/BadD/HgdB
MKDADPQPVSAVEIDMARYLSMASGSRRIINELADALETLNADVKDRINKGIGILEKGAPRVAALFLHLADPVITRMIEKSGLSIPVLLVDLIIAKHKKAPSIISGEILAEEEMQSGLFHGSSGFIQRAAEALKDSNMDGLLWNYLYNCRPIAQMSHLLKQFVEKETGVPVLSLESDLVDSRTYSAESQRIKVETFAEMLRAKKAT